MAGAWPTSSMIFQIPGVLWINLVNVMEGSSIANPDLLLTFVDSFSSRHDPTWFPK
jgi:hypothetical protein